MATFEENFREHLRSIGCTPPETFEDKVGKALGYGSAMLGYIARFGPNATVSTLIGAGFAIPFAADVALVAGGLTAAYFAGAYLGAALEASGKTWQDAIAEAGRAGHERTLREALRRNARDVPQGCPERPVLKVMAWNSTATEWVKAEYAACARDAALLYLLSHPSDPGEVLHATVAAEHARAAFEAEKANYEREWNAAWP